jgi:hypothetical protein
MVWRAIAIPRIKLNKRAITISYAYQVKNQRAATGYLSKKEKRVSI